MKREGFTKRPGFFHGVAMALVLAAISGVTFTALTPVFEGVFLLRFLVTGAAGAYIVYLLHRSGLRTGRIATMSMWGLAVIAIWFFTPSFGWFVIAHTALIWLVRAGYFYTGLLPALMDLALSALALVAAVAAAEHTGSLFLSMWCFFLVQALFVRLPEDIRSRRTSHASPSDPFEKAYRSADAALRRLSTQP